MKRKHIVFLIVTVYLLVSMAMANAVGEPKHDDFWALLEGDNWLLDGTGTGWNQGEWIYYDTTDWWNQWFYDDPPSWDRRKHIDYLIDIVPFVPDPVLLTESQISVEVALNWSTMEYPETGPDGMPPMPPEEWAIERKVVFAEDGLVPGGVYTIDGAYDIWDYNPEWVSIDVRVYSWGQNVWTDPATGMTFVEEVLIPVEIVGSIIHECIIPEPATVSLLALGALALLKRKK